MEVLGDSIPAMAVCPMRYMARRPHHWIWAAAEVPLKDRRAMGAGGLRSRPGRWWWPGKFCLTVAMPSGGTGAVGVEVRFFCEWSTEIFRAMDWCEPGVGWAESWLPLVAADASRLWAMASTASVAPWVEPGRSLCEGQEPMGICWWRMGA